MRFIRIILSLSLLFVCLLLLPIDNVTSTAVVNENFSKSKKIILDPGHGGFDGGAQGDDGTLEKNINLSIALKTKEMLVFCGYDVIMTRYTDTGTEKDSSVSIAKRKVSDMKRRLEVINENPDAIFVSVHLNKFTSSSAVGAQVFYSSNHEHSKVLAESLQISFNKLLQPSNDRIVKKGGNSIYLLKNAKVPAIISECGFLSNKKELEALKTDEYQSKIAFVLCCGINDYYATVKNAS
jgi:N-acetylmuramoyl-L-alanine amidase